MTRAGRRRIALVVDHPERDLGGLVLLADELCRRGADCFLFSTRVQDRELWAVAPDFVLLNYLRPNYEPLMRRLIAAGIPYGALDTEGGVLPTLADYDRTLPRDPALMRAARLFCVWGRRLGAHLERSGAFRADQIVVTGCPRFDFYHDRWAPVLRLGTTELNGKSLILINTNFTIGNPRFGTVEANEQSYVTHFGFTPERFRAWYEAELRTIREVSEVANGLARRFPAAQVVLRPHPFERAETYLDAVQHPNLSVHQSGPVQPWIVRAAAVIQRGCTTAIEAGLADRPALSPRWIESHIEQPVAEAVSVACGDPEALYEHTGRALEGTFTRGPDVDAALEETIADWFCAADGQAHARAAAAILEAVPAPSPVNLDVCRRYLYGLTEDRPRWATVPAALRMALGVSPTTSWRGLLGSRPVAAPDAKYFDREAVEMIAARIAGRRGAAPVRVAWAHDAGGYRIGTFAGQTVQMTMGEGS